MSLISATAQVNPLATTLTDGYTVPADTYFEGHVIVANRSAVATTFRISIAIAGAADSPAQYIAYDVTIGSNAVVASPRFAIGPADVVRVYATLATLAFSITGLERA